MKNILIAFALIFLGIQVLTAQEKPLVKDSIRQLVNTDTLADSSNWIIRLPLTPEEQQRREDNRAEVEDMKHRFRQFHQEETQRQAEERAAEEDKDFIWADAEYGGQLRVKGNTAVNDSSGINTANMRMEIGRNLQEGRSATVPNSPVLPVYEEEAIPEAYDNNANRREGADEDWKNTISSSFQSRAAEPQWQAKVGNADNVILPPGTNTPLTAGQIILLESVSFSPGSSTIRVADREVLDAWALLLRSNPGLIVEVRAHTYGNIGAFEAQQLTNQRAQNITDYWVGQGALSKQLSYRGYGTLSPLVASSNPLAKQKNERIELIILELTER